MARGGARRACSYRRYFRLPKSLHLRLLGKFLIMRTEDSNIEHTLSLIVEVLTLAKKVICMHGFFQYVESLIC